MHPDIPGITSGNEAITDGLSDLHAEVHESLRILRELRDLLQEFRPLIDAYRQTGGGSIGLVRARRALRNGRD